MIAVAATNHFLADHLGSTNALTDSTGAITSSATYDSFGNPTGNLATRYGFTGRENDATTGVMHYRARFYDPKLGRFTSEDPIGFAGGDVNLYGYVSNNPVNFRDPSGLFPFTATPIPYRFPRFTGSEAADYLDARFDTAQDFYGGYDPVIGFNSLTQQPVTGFGALRGLANMLRIGNGAAHALYAEDENGWGRAAFCMMDVERGAGLFGMMAGSFGGRVGAARSGPPASPPPSRGPSFIAASDGSVFPVPQGASGPLPTRAPGMQYTGGFRRIRT